MPETTVILDLSRQPQLPADHKTLREVALKLEIRDEQAYAIANEMVLKSDQWTKSVESFFEQGKKQAHAAHLWFTTTIRNLTTPYDVRPVLVPKMTAYRAEQERQRRAAELRAQQEEAERQRAAQVEAQRIAREAAEAAEQLRQAGQMRLAREREEAAQVQAAAVVQQAEDLAAIGTIAPRTRPLGGPKEAMPWIGEVTDMKALCLAIGQGKVPLEYLTPVRGEADQMRPLLVCDTTVLNNIAKRMGQQDLHIPGVRGLRGLHLRFGKGMAAAGIKPDADAGEDW